MPVSWPELYKVALCVEADAHIDAPGTNTVLIMTSSDRSCLQLRQYLTTMIKTSPPFGPQSGRKMMETLFLSNWQHEKNGERLSNPAKMVRGQAAGGDEVKVKAGEMEEKRLESAGMRDYKSRGRGRGTPSYKRRRLRGGAEALGRRTAQELEM